MFSRSNACVVEIYRWKTFQQQVFGNVTYTVAFLELELNLPLPVQLGLVQYLIEIDEALLTAE